MEHTIANEYLHISVKETGAELCRIQSVTTGKDFMWNADPAGYEEVLRRFLTPLM